MWCKKSTTVVDCLLQLWCQSWYWYWYHSVGKSTGMVILDK